MTQNSKIINFFIEFVKDEINKPEFKIKFIRPLLIYILYYIIPFMAIFLVLNFITTFFSVFLVFNLKNNILIKK
jgi:flagellar biosynthesis protein FlhB